MFTDLDALREQIRSLGLNRLEEKIIGLSKPCIYMTREAVDDNSIPVGTSKLGGLPDLPPDFEWPFYGAVPLTFIGQFKFSEFYYLDSEGILPQRGILYYFIETDEMIFGTYEQRGSWRVFYVEDENALLVRTVHPTYQGAFRFIDALPAHQIEFQKAISLPRIFFDQRHDYDIVFSDIPDYDDREYWSRSSEFGAYWELASPFKEKPTHCWLGHPQRWQGSVEEEVVINSQQIETQRFPDQLYRYTEDQIAHIQSEMKKWQFLLQIGTDGSLDVIWGETGTLYICIPKDSLANRRFEDCWTIMQCT